MDEGQVNDQSTTMPIIGIGASAGGIAALKRFFSDMPSDRDMAFVVIQHLAPDRESRMPEVLQQFTETPVSVAVDDEPVQANHVYVIPPGKLLSISDGRLQVQDDPPAHRQRMPIDFFFRSLGEDRGSKAIGVILSGAGTDGALGLEVIKENGGLTLAEAAPESEDSSAWWGSMPRAAAATGAVDVLDAADKMPQHIIAYAEQLAKLADTRQAQALKDTVAEHLPEICSILLAHRGQDFRHYKSTTLIRRVLRRVQIQGTDVGSYVARLREDSAETELLAKELLIHVSSFFRDPEAFHALQEQVIRPLVNAAKHDEVLRTWVIGCSTGEEAYTLAILFHEVISEARATARVQIFATDTDAEMVEIARAGRYPHSIAHDITTERLTRYFIDEGDAYRVAPDVRNCCIFSVHDVIRTAPFSRLHLISCRNLLIYLDNDLQKRLIPLFHFALREKGALFLGHSENVTQQQQQFFAATDKKHRIFQKREQVSRPPLEIPLFSAAQRPQDIQHASAEHEPPKQQSLTQKAPSMVLDEFAPPHVVVDEHNTIQYFSRGTGRVLQPAPGVARHNILDMARPGLRHSLRTALSRAAQSGTQVRLQDVQVTDEGERISVDLTVRPIPPEAHGDHPQYLIVFRCQPTVEETEKPKDRGGAQGHDHDRQLQELERELESTKEDFQTTVEELETSNEELQSTNEELLSMNEELQSSNEEMEASKEELQSVNEEMETVNQELNEKISELRESQQDIETLLHHSGVGMVFLEPDLRIRRFTMHAQKVFSLISSDIGRPITDISAKFDPGNLESLVRESLRTRETYQNMIHVSENGRSYMMRIMPYKPPGSRSGRDYSVILFVDVTDVVSS